VNAAARYRSNQPLRLLVFPLATSYPTRPSCVVTVSANTAMTVYAVHVPPGRYGLKARPVTDQRWITAPAWLLVKDNGYGGTRVQLWPHYAVRAGVSPYVVSRALKVNEIRAALGRPESYSPKHGWQPQHRPATGTVTFHHAAVTALSVAR
jgi:hypothetical protein